MIFYHFHGSSVLIPGGSIFKHVGPPGFARLIEYVRGDNYGSKYYAHKVW